MTKSKIKLPVSAEKIATWPKDAQEHIADLEKYYQNALKLFFTALDEKMELMEDNQRLRQTLNDINKAHLNE